MLDNKKRIKEIVKTLSKGLDIPVFCKIRILDTWEKTKDIVVSMEEVGCSLIAVHGRTLLNIRTNTGKSN